MKIRRFWDRSMLKCGHIVKGPAIISEMDSNTVILPSYKAEVDHVGNIVIWEAKTMTNGITSAVNGARNGVAHTLNGLTNGITNGATNGLTNGHANGISKDEPLNMVTGLLLTTFRYAKLTCAASWYFESALRNALMTTKASMSSAIRKQQE
jgi:hypothetical protein